MNTLYLYADDQSREVLLGADPKILLIGSDFGFGNFGDVLQHINTLNFVKEPRCFNSVSVFAASAITDQGFPRWARSVYGSDAIIFVSDYPLILKEDDPAIKPIAEIKNIAAVHLYGGGFLNNLWGDYVLGVAEYFLKRLPGLSYYVSGQQLTPGYEIEVLRHIKAYNPKLFAVRDDLSQRTLQEAGYSPDFSFDDATEALGDLSDKVGLKSGDGLLLHLNSSEYSNKKSSQALMIKELEMLAQTKAANSNSTVLQAFRDTRQEVYDSFETVKRLDRFFPFPHSRHIDLVGLIFDPPQKNLGKGITGQLGYSCSYHVALWLQLAGIPCWLRSNNPYYDQKARALKVSQGLIEFIHSPQLSDHRLNLERRAEWKKRFSTELSSLELQGKNLKIDDSADGPSSWAFFYKGRPTLEEKLAESYKESAFHRERADATERTLDSQVGALKQQLSQVSNEVHHERERADFIERELSGRTEALTIQLTAIGHEAHSQRERADFIERELSGRIEALTIQLTAVGHEAHSQRERADITQRELGERVEALKVQLNAVYLSRSWRWTSWLRAFGQLLRLRFPGSVRLIKNLVRGKSFLKRAMLANTFRMRASLAKAKSLLRLKGKDTRVGPTIVDPHRPGVFMLVDSFFDGGVERVVIDLCLQLRDCGRVCKILVAKEGGRSAQEARSHGIEVIEFRQDAESLRHFVASHGHGILITHHCYFGLEIFHGAGMPIAEVVHNAYYWQKENANIADLRKSYISKFIAVSDFVRRYSVDELNLDQNRVELINNGLSNLDLIRPPLDLLRNRRKQTCADPVLLHVANLHPQKNHRLVVNAFCHIKKSLPRARLIMAGAMEGYPDLYRALLDDIERLDLTDSVDLTGPLSRRELAEKMSFSHIGLLPSILEGFSIATLEFAYYGLPSVLSATGAAFELKNAFGHVEIADGCALAPSELSVESIDTAVKNCSESAVAALSESVLKVLDSYPEYLDRALVAAREVSSYSISNTTAQFNRLLQSLEGRGALN